MLYFVFYGHGSRHRGIDWVDEVSAAAFWGHPRGVCFMLYASFCMLWAWNLWLILGGCSVGRCC